MTTSEILKHEINHELHMVKIWREKLLNAKTPEVAEFYKSSVMKSTYRADAKAEIAMSLGYTVLYSDSMEECISVYPMELDD